MVVLIFNGLQFIFVMFSERFSNWEEIPTSLLVKFPDISFLEIKKVNVKLNLLLWIFYLVDKENSFIRIPIKLRNHI